MTASGAMGSQIISKNFRILSSRFWSDGKKCLIKPLSQLATSAQRHACFYRYGQCGSAGPSMTLQCPVRWYEAQPSPRETPIDPKEDAVDVFKTAVAAAEPRAMIEKLLRYDSNSNSLWAGDTHYQLQRNVYVVGFGVAVLGMASVVDGLLGPHLVTGIISVPRGLPQELRDTGNRDMLLPANSRIVVYEGAAGNQVDQSSYEASKAIQRLVSGLTKRDLLIVLSSGGGSVLFPSPRPPITLDDLIHVSRLLTLNGANIHQLNTVRKNIETLKGGGLALLAKPAKVLSLILSSIIGDPKDLIASGTTCPSQPTPHHCLEILERLGIRDQTPDSIVKHLEREARSMDHIPALTAQDSIAERSNQDNLWSEVQNIVVGNNTIACQAAAARATELGYLALVLTTTLTGEARQVGGLFIRIAKFVMMCFDRKASCGPNSELSILETDLVARGIQKAWINKIADAVDRAHNTNRDICIIAGGETVVRVRGCGVGGKNMEAALAAAIYMKEEFRSRDMSAQETGVCFLSCDTDGLDGITKMAGAVVDREFLDKVEECQLDMGQFLDNNDSFNLFSQVNEGRNLVCTRLTGTNVMDMVLLMVQRPPEDHNKYQGYQPQ